jgi:hypothetical protein
MGRLPSTLGRLADESEAFLLNWAEREKEKGKTFRRVWRLKELAYRPIEEFPDLAERFRLFEEWLIEEGLDLASATLTRFQIEEILAALEKLKLFLPRAADSEAGAPGVDELEELAQKFVALLEPNLSGETARKTSAGGKVIPPPQAPPVPGGDLLEQFKSSLKYQMDCIEHYHRPGENLLSALGRVLDGLSARYHAADEVLAAHLLYFLQALNYPVGPYLEKFRQIKAGAKKK